ncbi:MAG: Homocitrate synthase [Myxococcota bacterium]|nr:Homocitrate synthase [Myxococcota bacterium]
MSIFLTDNTLREGEQVAGVDFSIEEKCSIAMALDEFGVHRLDAGMPASGEKECKTIRSLLDLHLRAEVGVSCRVNTDDVAQAIELRPAAVYLITPASRRRLEHMNWDLPGMIEKARPLVLALAAERIKVHLAVEDASRAAEDDIVALVNAFGGAVDTAYLCDTVGVHLPWEAREWVRRIRARVPEPLHLGYHGHNDLGMAAGNSLAAWQGGARHVSVTVNGLGERAGNASLSTLTACLVRMELAKGLKAQRLPRLAALVETASGIPVSPLEPVVGAFAFAHASGVHAHAALQDEQAYTDLEPSLFDRQHEYPLGKKSGRYAIRALAGPAAQMAPPEALDQLLQYIKEHGKPEFKQQGKQFVAEFRGMMQSRLNLWRDVVAAIAHTSPKTRK